MSAASPKFKVDENLPENVSESLRQAGYDTHWVREEGLAGADDARLLEACRKERRALITLDLDFLDAKKHPAEGTAGIVVLRLRSQAVPFVLAAVRRIVRVLPHEPLAGKLWIVDPKAIRIR